MRVARGVGVARGGREASSPDLTPYPPLPQGEGEPEAPQRYAVMRARAWVGGEMGEAGRR